MRNPYSQFSVQKKVALVTGGSGKLGAIQVKMLVDAKAKVVSFDCKSNPSLPKSCKQIKVDVTNRDSIEEGYNIVKKRFGDVDILINNAGVDTPPTDPKAGRVRFEKFPVEEWNRVFDVNLKAMFLCCQVIGGAMAKRKKGTIINIGSIYGMLSPDQRIYKYMSKKKDDQFFKPVAYSASKSGVMNMTRYLATYWGSDGVRVNTLVPGGVFNNQDPKFLSGYTQKVPIGRMANPEELVGGILYLASDASTYVTGTSLIIDGGYSAW